MRRTAALILLALVGVGLVMARHADRPRAAGPPPLPAGTPTGRLVMFGFHSAALGRRAGAAVLLPPDYARDAAEGTHYPVLYLLHPPRGSALDYVRKGWLVHDYELLLARGEIRPMLVVIPFGYTRRFTDDTEWANAKAGRYEDFVLDLVQAVDRRYPTLADRAHRALAGLSEGGYGALNIGLHHLDRFAILESWSGYFRQTPTASFTGTGPAMLAANSPAVYVPSLAPAIRRFGLRVYLYQGIKDQEHPGNMVRFRRELARAGAEVGSGFFYGGHGWGLWHRQMPHMLWVASHWFASSPARAFRGRLMVEGGRPAPWNSYYHFRGHPAHRRRGRP